MYVYVYVRECVWACMCMCKGKGGKSMYKSIMYKGRARAYRHGEGESKGTKSSRSLPAHYCLSMRQVQMPAPEREKAKVMAVGEERNVMPGMGGEVLIVFFSH